MRYVLCVEDDVVVGRLLQMVLRGQGIRSQIAPTLEAARAAYKSERPDLIVLDIGLPDGPGYELVIWLRANETDVPPIVAVSASAMPADRKRALEVGCADFIAKPIDTRTFGPMISALIDPGTGS